MTTATRTAAAIAAAIILGAFAGLTVGGRTVTYCGTVTEDHVTAPAYCGDVAELQDALDRIAAERSGGRFAPITVPADGPAPASYGPDRDPETADYAPGWTYADGAERAARAYGAALQGVTVTPREVNR